MQECQPLSDHFLDQKIDAGSVAARPGKARNKTKRDRVVAGAEDDRVPVEERAEDFTN
jgi:hypothetical protein